MHRRLTTLAVWCTCLYTLDLCFYLYKTKKQEKGSRGRARRGRCGRELKGRGRRMTEAPLLQLATNVKAPLQRWPMAMHIYASSLVPGLPAPLQLIDSSLISRSPLFLFHTYPSLQSSPAVSCSSLPPVFLTVCHSRQLLFFFFFFFLIITLFSAWQIFNVAG